MSPYEKIDAERPASLDSTSADERTLCDSPLYNEDFAGRPSSEESDMDHDILESEDERERLLTQKEGGIAGLFGKKGVKIGKRERKAAAAKAKEHKSTQDGETNALLPEMEEGVSRTTASRRSSESDQRRLRASSIHRKVGLETLSKMRALLMFIGSEV
jgi:hypothetical protein